MDRRSVLTALGITAVGFGGWRYRAQIGAIADGNISSPETDNPIKEIEGDGFLRDLTLYESGAARLEFDDDYSCFERIAVGDTTNLRGSNLGEWRLPRDGDMVVDMQRAVSRTKDPSNVFWLRSLGGVDNYCFGANEILLQFAVPRGWIQ